MFNRIPRTTDFRSILPTYLDKLLKLPGTYPSSDYAEICTGATRLPNSTETFSRWSLDTHRYTHHPAENYNQGKMVGFTKDLTDHHGVIAVKSLELVGNGEMERYNWFWLDVAKYGNIYIIITPGTCQNWSPVPEAVGSDPFRKELNSIRYVYNLSEEEATRDSKGCAEKIGDYKAGPGRSAVSIMPGPYPTHTSHDDAAYEQCEFGMHHQSVEYTPPKPIFDTQTVPSLGGQYCVRLMESDHNSSDTVLLQAAFSISAFALPFVTELRITHDIANQHSVHYNHTNPALAAVVLHYTP